MCICRHVCVSVCSAVLHECTHVLRAFPTPSVWGVLDESVYAACRCRCTYRGKQSRSCTEDPAPSPRSPDLITSLDDPLSVSLDLYLRVPRRPISTRGLVTKPPCPLKIVYERACLCRCRSLAMAGGVLDLGWHDVVSRACSQHVGRRSNKPNNKTIRGRRKKKPTAFTSVRCAIIDAGQQSLRGYVCYPFSLSLHSPLDPGSGIPPLVGRVLLYGLTCPCNLRMHTYRDRGRESWEECYHVARSTYVCIYVCIYMRAYITYMRGSEGGRKA
ncbi:hypothetical protein GGS23DRAFT_195059 [Durotheca rogersii]|uniref:uncharacterized protein n=1 Tax=Durotheca rogersii TaxID=419775 RepID=UPI00221ECC9A|nr:uncharacterized protein GGS23DRAFT_195059 [Durotheca rogersii]KAI5867782.1 hypothetical protein GGS23DRAFT_195059 [Durotheca rogersii]